MPAPAWPPAAPAAESAPGARRPRVLELYCGIGGCAAALAGAAEVVAALDIDRDALAVAGANFGHPTAARHLGSVRADELAAFAADLWWLSPPCQPFTRRGLRRDVDDPRCASFVHLVGLLAEVRPRHLGLENVPPFAGSRAHRLLVETLAAAGYSWHETILCPSELGMPNRRRRLFLVASREPLAAPPPAGAPPARRPLAELLDPAADDDPRLRVPADLVAAYRRAIDVVDAGDTDAVTATFTSAYGRSPVRSGSYLRRGDALRRFSPREVLALLGFPRSYRLPPDVSLATAWRLAGNSLSVPAVRAALAVLPDLPLAPPAGEVARPSLQRRTS